MAIAAIPAYLGTDFSSASPGLRFNMYLPIWQENTWCKVKSKVEDIKHTVKLNDEDKKLLKALRDRQLTLADAKENENAAQLLRLEAIAIAPFATGLGNEHPLENGFAFLNPYGLPYLAGSGVKGVLRRAARELANGLFGITDGWTHEAIIALFGDASGSDDNGGQRGALTFWDVIPGIEGDALKVEIMTPHQSHYLQGSATPHDSGQPIPINFLAVPPKSKFNFVIQCDLPHLARIAPEFARDGRWKVLLQAALKHAFDWLGFGAKTAVGYGAMQVDPALQKRLDAEATAVRKQREREERAARFSPQGLLIDDFVQRCMERHQARQANPAIRKEPLNPGQGIYADALKLGKAAIDGGDWGAEDRKQLAEVLAEWLPKLVEKLDAPSEWKDARKKLQLAKLRGED